MTRIPFDRGAVARALAEPVLNPAPGYCKHCKQYTIEEPLPAEPVQEPCTYKCETWPECECAKPWQSTPAQPVPPIGKASTDVGVPVFVVKKAEPVEPVAWMVYTEDGKSVCVTDNPADFTDEHRVLPLYTAPPKRTPLTEEVLDQRYYVSTGQMLREQDKRLAFLFARAIEAAHGIKEET